MKIPNKILKALDSNAKSESCAVLATLVDWRQAFPRQCPILGIQSFIQNGVRPALIPMLMNYFQGRKMKVKWHGEISKARELKGGGPQGSTFGIWEYLSQSNDNADCIDESERFKFVDDLTFLEVIYLLNVGLSSYNVRQHVPSHIPTHNQVISSENLKSQHQLKIINDWTKKKIMKLNEKNTQNMIFNFSKKFQFTTNMSVNSKPLDIVRETKLLGTYITDDLKWNKNTSEIVKKAYQRIQLLNRASGFSSSKHDLKQIYLIFVRSILEQSAVVWHSGLTARNSRDLERVQKVAVKIILGKSYDNYSDGLKSLKLDSLKKRREKICLKFAKNCIQNDKVRNMFPRNKKKHGMKTRSPNVFQIQKTKTKRYKKSAIPYMVSLLNKDALKNKKLINTVEK